NCFYLASWERIKGKRVLDFENDPPPDLAIEIDMTSDSLPRLPIYAALGVPEVWRFDGNVITCHVLTEAGDYAIVDTSRSFSWLQVSAVPALLEGAFDLDDEALKQRFESW